MDASSSATESQSRDHRADRLTGRIDARVLDAPGAVHLPVEGPQASLEDVRLTDLLAVRRRVEL